MLPETLKTATLRLKHWPVPITISNTNGNDFPLVFVNKAFSNLTGYDANDCIGKNCRFLQGEGTDKSAIVKLRKAVHGHYSISICLLNYRKDGSAFHNLLQMTPIDLTDHRHLLLGCQYEFSYPTNSIEIKNQLEAVAGAFRELDLEGNPTLSLFKKSIQSRTEGTRLLIDNYMASAKLARVVPKT